MVKVVVVVAVYAHVYGRKTDAGRGRTLQLLLSRLLLLLILILPLYFPPLVLQRRTETIDFVRGEFLLRGLAFVPACSYLRNGISRSPRSGRRILPVLALPAFAL